MGKSDELRVQIRSDEAYVYMRIIHGGKLSYSKE